MPVALALFHVFNFHHFTHATHSAADDHNNIANLESLGLNELIEYLIDEFIWLGQTINEDGVDSTKKSRCLTTAGNTGTEAHDTHARAESSSITCHLASFTEHNDELGADVDRSLDGTTGNRLATSKLTMLGNRRIDHRTEHVVVVSRLLGLTDGTCHDINSLLEEGSVGSLTTEHDGIGTIVNSVGDIGALGTSRTGVAHHRLEHLRGGNDGLALNVGTADHVLLRQKDLGGWDLHTQITTGHHDGIGLTKDVVIVLQTLKILNLANDLDLRPAILLKQAAEILHIIPGTDKGGGDELDLLLDAKVDNVILVLVGEGGQIDLYAGKVHVLPLSNGGIVHDATTDLTHGLVAFQDGQNERSIGNQNLLPRTDRSCELGVGAGNLVLIAEERVVGRKDQLLPLLKSNLIDVIPGEETCADLRSLGIEKDGNVASLLACNLAKAGEGLAVALCK